MIAKRLAAVLCFVFTGAILVSGRYCRPEKPFLRYHKFRSCHKSSMSVIAWKNTEYSDDCAKYAREKSGLAFNFSPADIRNFTTSGIRYKSCQILGCPETTNSSTLIYDPMFDYYSAYANSSAEIVNNATCIPSVGVFFLVQTKKNYTDAIKHCQSLDADLADILSELRTNTLADSMVSSLKDWYQVAFVGLEDTETENKFTTPMGFLLECIKFRAWGPGHPRPTRRNEDCVTLDNRREWRAVNCKAKLASICEMYPSGPADAEDSTDCDENWADV